MACSEISIEYSPILLMLPVITVAAMADTVIKGVPGLSLNFLINYPSDSGKTGGIMPATLIEIPLGRMRAGEYVIFIQN
jgi:hypothetical protein